MSKRNTPPHHASIARKRIKVGPLVCNAGLINRIWDKTTDVGPRDVDRTYSLDNIILIFNAILPC
jgi:hypothetical protein